MMTETWLYENGDEADITEMTPSDHVFQSFSRKMSLAHCLSFKVIKFESFEAVEAHACRDSTSVHAVCLYRPPPSRKSKMTNTMFLNEVPRLPCFVH